MRNLCMTFVALFVWASGISQPVCGFDVVHQTKLHYDRTYRRAVEENEHAVQNYLSRNRSRLSARTTGLNSTLYTIPVVVHVMHSGTAVGAIDNPGDAQIQSAINYLNEIYNGSYPGLQGIGDLQVQFQLASIGPSCNASSGIERIDASAVPGYAASGVSTQPGIKPGTDELNVKNLSRWDPLRYYNIWVVNKIDGMDGTSGTYTAGYAYFPGAAREYDGTVILATQMIAGSKTLPHELAHAFGLYHVFEGSNDKNSCPANANCDLQGDYVCDTDPVTYNQSEGVYDFTCRSGINLCTGAAYSSNTESNFMNYTTCYNLFTAGQKARVLANAASLYRKSLTGSWALETSYPLHGYTAPTASLCTPASDPIALSDNYAGILNIELNERNLQSSTAKLDNGYVDGTALCLNLIPLQHDETNTISVQVLGANTEQLRGWIDYNNDGVFNNAGEQIFFTSSVTESSPVFSASFSVPADAPLNTVLRMRVMDDLSTIYGISAIGSACSNPVYGQAEDYPVFITSGVLPVTLIRFDGIIKNNAAQLSWLTSGEINLENFEVEKSADGSRFTTIGTISARGVPGVNEAYTFTDQNPGNESYYRLRMNDMDGSSKYSKVVLLRSGAVVKPFSVVNNPFSNFIEMKCSAPAQKLQLQLINSLGAVIAQAEYGAATGSLRWNLPGNISRGHYVLKAVYGGQWFTTKLLKQ